MGSEEQSLLDEVAARQGSALLDSDNIPNANQSLTCFSCEEPMTGLYCYACGNKNDNYRRSIWSLGVELFQSLTAFEGRIWRSLYSLIFRPGQMAREFSDGARQKWTSPIRLFLATSLLLFGYITLSDTQMVALGDLKEKTEASNSVAGIHFDTGPTDFTQTLLFFVRKSDLKVPPENPAEMQLSAMLEDLRTGWNNYDDEEIEEAIASIDAQILENEGTDLQALQVTREMLVKRLESKEEFNESFDDAAEEIEDELRDVFAGIAESDRQMTMVGADGETISLDAQGMAGLYDRILRNPQIINNQLNTKLKWAMFFMMPFAMFMGALFIRGRETAMLYDHLVHAAYVHSFSFLLLFTFILIYQFTSVSGLLFLYTMILLVYLPMSAKGSFQRGWFKSILTAYGVGSIYTLIIFIISVGIIISALHSVAAEFDTGTTVVSSDAVEIEDSSEAPDPQTTTESPPLPQTQPPQ